MPQINVSERVYGKLQRIRSERGGDFSGTISNLLKRMPSQTIEFLSTKDSGLIGAIGETFAWQYLWNHDIIAFELGYGRPSFKPLDTLIQLKDRLTEEQLSFLGHDREHMSWDFVGISKRHLARLPIGPRGTRACLIEVKTSRPGKRVDGFRPEGRRGMAPDDLREAKRLRFTMHLVTVELTENWQAIVTEQEIPVD